MPALRDKRLDASADQMNPSVHLSEQLFAFVDALRANSQLRRVLTDPTRSVEGRRHVVTTLLAGKLSADALQFISDALTHEWPSGILLADNIERQAIRIGLKASDLDRVVAELNEIRELILQNEDLRLALGGTSGSAEAHAGLVAQLLGDRSEPTTLLLVTRCARPGANLLNELADCQELASQVRGRRLARVTVARPLPADQAADLVHELVRIYGTPVDLAQHIDPDVLGGVRVQIGDEVIDGTVSAKLEQARRGIA